MVDRPVINFREIGRAGDDLPRQVRALEAAVKELAQQTQRILEELAAPQSPFTYKKVKEAGNLDEVECGVYDVYATAALALTMPPHKQNRLVVIKDGGGNAGTFNITLKRRGSAGTINGVAGDYVVSNNGEFAWFMSDGTNQNWRRLILG